MPDRLLSFFSPGGVGSETVQHYHTELFLMCVGPITVLVHAYPYMEYTILSSCQCSSIYIVISTD